VASHPWRPRPASRSLPRRPNGPRRPVPRRCGVRPRRASRRPRRVPVTNRRYVRPRLPRSPVLRLRLPRPPLRRLRLLRHHPCPHDRRIPPPRAASRSRRHPACVPARARRAASRSRRRRDWPGVPRPAPVVRQALAARAVVPRVAPAVRERAHPARAALRVGRAVHRVGRAVHRGVRREPGVPAASPLVRAVPTSGPEVPADRGPPEAHRVAVVRVVAVVRDRTAVARRAGAGAGARSRSCSPPRPRATRGATPPSPRARSSSSAVRAPRSWVPS